MKTSSTQSGAIAIYLALLVTVIILSGAILQSGILSQQIRFSTDVLQNERAFYASDTGIEAVLYDLQKKIEQGESEPPSSTMEDSISYDSQTTSYAAKGSVTIGQTGSIPCVESTGTSGREVRRTAVGTPDCQP